MAYRYAIDSSSGLALVRFSDTVSAAELTASVRALFEDASYVEQLDVIWDGSGITHLVLVPGDLEELAVLKDHYRRETHAGRDVIVVVREIDYVAARLYVHLARRLHQRLTLCHSLDEALDVLGLPALPVSLNVRDVA